jgi:ubiquinone/menaquinone biosynthesis C-methylase UbiE
MADNPFTDTTKKALSRTTDRQGRNRSWWETKPMTYADWNSEDRMPDAEEDFLQIEEYVQRTGPWLKNWFENIQIEGQNCLDLGSGSGIFSSLLARRGGQVTSLDLTEAGVKLTKKMAQFFEVPTRVVRGDAENSPLKSNYFDFVYSWGVLHHTSDMDAALKEASRVLKPGGKGMMMVYHKNSVVYYIHGLFWLLFRGKLFSGHNFESVQGFYTDGFYHRYLTKAQLKQKLATVGLSVNSFHITQYEKKILPGIPSGLDEFLKRRFGMCLVAEFSKPDSSK